jgi:hypothetical protein
MVVSSCPLHRRSSHSRHRSRKVTLRPQSGRFRITPAPRFNRLLAPCPRRAQTAGDSRPIAGSSGCPRPAQSSGPPRWIARTKLVPKLTVRVRFPSPAPHAKSVAAHTNRAKIQPLGSSVRSMRFHPLAIDSRSSRRDQPTRGPPIRVLVMTSSPQLVVQSVSDRTVSPTSRVLVDDCRVHAVVTHPRHQVTRARAGLSRQGVPRAGSIRGTTTPGEVGVMTCTTRTDQGRAEGDVHVGIRAVVHIRWPKSCQIGQGFAAHLAGLGC